jgi:hypothetical protein
MVNRHGTPFRITAGVSRTPKTKRIKQPLPQRNRNWLTLPLSARLCEASRIPDWERRALPAIQRKSSSARLTLGKFGIA